MKTAEISARIKFSPTIENFRRKDRLSEFWIHAEVDDGLHFYYAWWLNRYATKMKIHRPVFGCHVTVTRDRDFIGDDKREIFLKLKEKYDGKIIKIHHGVDPYQKKDFWCIGVEPHPILCEIRESLGLKNSFPFHITIGRVGL